MQYKKNIKIVIDKRKLDLLIRLNCPKDVIYNAIVYNTITKVGDELIDDTLEALIDVKEFNNWGGKREGSGRKNHLENQVENHLENQESNQVVDKDRDIDIDNINLYGEYKNVYLTEEKLREYEAYCLGKENAKERIEYLSQQIEQGKENGFNSKYPNAHFVRLKQLFNSYKKLRRIEPKQEEPKNFYRVVR
jgi:hypothetical protein